MFVAFVNDLPSHLKSKCLMFAKGRKICRKPAIASDLQDDVNVLTEWFDTWKLHFNIYKCKVIHCGLYNPNIDCKMQEQTLRLS